MKWENFTKPVVGKFTCAPGKKQSIHWDGKQPGLGLRVTAGGTKSYIFETSLNGNTLRITIGDPETWTVKKAQDKAAEYKTQTDQGIDPRQVKAELQADQAAKRECQPPHGSTSDGRMGRLSESAHATVERP